VDWIGLGWIRLDWIGLRSDSHSEEETFLGKCSRWDWLGLPRGYPRGSGNSSTTHTKTHHRRSSHSAQNNGPSNNVSGSFQRIRKKVAFKLTHSLPFLNHMQHRNMLPEPMGCESFLHSQMQGACTRKHVGLMGTLSACCCFIINYSSTLMAIASGLSTRSSSPKKPMLPSEWAPSSKYRQSQSHS
jgi:hypothetical protein